MKQSILLKALNDGWTIRKHGTKYIFSKPHEQRKEYLEKEYIYTFLTKYCK